MEYSLHSNFVVGKFAEENQARFEQLERDRDHLSQIALVTGAVGIGAFAFSTLSALTAIPALWKTAEAISTISRRFLLMSELIEAFEREDIAIEVGLKTEGIREIDFFLRFPDKEYVLVQIRSAGKTKLVYNESKQVLQHRRKGGGLKTWKPDPLLELMEQERWVRRERTDLLGTSAKDRRRPFAKLLVLWSDDEFDDHSETLYSTINESKYLTIRRTGTTYLVPKYQVIDFIKDYLVSRRSSKTL